MSTILVILTWAWDIFREKGAAEKGQIDFEKEIEPLLHAFVGVEENFMQILCAFLLFYWWWSRIGLKKLSWAVLSLLDYWLLFDIPSYGSELGKSYTPRLFIMCLEVGGGRVWKLFCQGANDFPRRLGGNWSSQK